MPTPQISVVMPCFNAEATLGAAFSSVLGQEGADFEVVAVDDGSTDGTAGVLREWAGRDGRVRPVFAPHGGIVAALNAGLAAARGAYIARLDADDQCLPGRLARQAGFLDAGPELGLAGCRVRFGGDRRAAAGYARYVDWTNGLLDHEGIALNRFIESPLPHPSVMFRKGLVALHGGYRDGDFPEDYELWLRWLDAGVRMAKVDAELVVWNDPPDRLSRTDGRYGFEAFYRTKAEYLARWLKAGPLAGAARPVVGVLGAGRVTRKRAELLLAHGVEIACWYDLDPRKVGHVVAGRPVRHRDEVPLPGELFLLSYVGSVGAREDIATFLASRGYAPGRDWMAAA
ncbi:MAG: glycosyltransferase [Desulfovibrionaceae bacterium]